jgi:hypothetical protein
MGDLGTAALLQLHARFCVFFAGRYNFEVFARLR